MGEKIKFGGEVREGRSASLAKYLLRLKKTELIEESSDGYRVTNSFKPWMLTGVQRTPSNFKPSVPGLFDASDIFRTNSTNFFASVHEQVGQRVGLVRAMLSV